MIRKILFIFLSTVSVLNLPGCGLSPNWKTYTYMDPNFSIESPYPLISKWPPNMVFAAKTQTLNDNFQVGVAVEKVKTNLSVYKITEMFVKNIGEKGGFSDFKSVSKPVTFADCPAVMTEGTLKFRSKPMKVKLLDIKNKDLFWNISVFYQDNNNEFETMASRIIHSVKLLN